MIFNKNRKRMVDVRELQKRGVVKIPKQEINIPTNSDGFVELNKNTSSTSKSNTDFFGFTNTTTTTPTEPQTFQTESDGYNKREVDQKITDLDNKIYKLEQRIELLEKKLDINQPSNSGIIGW